MAVQVDEYFRTYGAMVFRRCMSILRDEEQAADAMQDTFVKLLRHQERLEDRAPSSLLYTIATNVCLNRLRSKKSDRTVDVGDAFDLLATTEDHAERVLATQFLEELFRTHHPSTRSMALAHYRDGRTLKETADRHGMSVSGVRKRLRGLREEAKALYVA